MGIFLSLLTTGTINIFSILFKVLVVAIEAGGMVVEVAHPVEVSEGHGRTGSSFRSTRTLIFTAWERTKTPLPH